ncbi:MAG: quinol:cytochrome C oxidoreductase [Flavobacteriaceae bacterium]|nr:MAG: quinol:cytochrome C oxidoreductase [Flavobacteriaceae bacterium]
MHNLSKVKNIALLLMLLGGILFGIGYNLNHCKDRAFVEAELKENPALFGVDMQSHGDHAAGEEHEMHMKHLENQVHNKPWTALYIASFLFTGIALASLFFFAVQQAAEVGWSHVVTRVMEAIASFLPYGGVIILLIFAASIFHENHLFHWMDESLSDPNSPHYDKFLHSKKPFLNKYLFAFVSVLFVGGWTYFLHVLKKKSRILDEHSSEANYQSLVNSSIRFIVFFAFSSMTIGIYWVMSLDPHWYSTLFGWYLMVSYLVSAIAFMILICLYLKSKGMLPKFNDNHLHDLAKFLFGFSLLWSYLWFDQFMLIWYANIPEEVVYFQARFEQYRETYFTALIPNLVLPLFILVASNNKRKPKLVAIMAVIVILGHFLDVFNVITPATVGGFWKTGFGLLEIGSFLFMLGLFGFVVFRQLSKSNLEPKGHPMFHESEIYEYPF